MIEYYIQEYNKGKSIKEIANSAGTYYSKVRRALIKHGAIIRNKSEAHKLALSSGKATHPTLGRKRREDEKKNISEAQLKRWQEMSEEEKSSIINKKREEWKKRGIESIEEMRKKAFSEIRKAARDGSSIERYLASELKLLGYNVQFHKNNLIPNEKLHIDIFLPDLYTAVEIDGPSHFSLIWGDSSLRRNRLSDKQKNGLLTGNGYNVVRLQIKFKHKSSAKLRTALNILLKVLNNIKLKNERSKVYLMEVT